MGTDAAWVLWRITNHKARLPWQQRRPAGQACAEESAAGVPRSGVEAQPLQDHAAGGWCHNYQVFQRGTFWGAEPQVWLDSGLEEKGLESRGGWRGAGSGIGDWIFSPLQTRCTPMPGICLPLLLSFLKTISKEPTRYQTQRCQVAWPVVGL